MAALDAYQHKSGRLRVQFQFQPDLTNFLRSQHCQAEVAALLGIERSDDGW